MLNETTKTKNERINILITYFDQMTDGLDNSALDDLMDVMVQLEMMEAGDFDADEGFSAREFVPKATLTNLGIFASDIHNKIETLSSRLEKIKKDLQNKQTYEETEGNY